MANSVARFKAKTERCRFRTGGHAAHAGLAFVAANRGFGMHYDIGGTSAGAFVALHALGFDQAMLSIAADFEWAGKT